MKLRVLLVAAILSMVTVGEVSAVCIIPSCVASDPKLDQVITAINAGGGGGGGGNVNLNQVGGVSFTLGQTTKSGSLPITLASDQGDIPVTGTFWQATQPVSASALPLPSGAATSSLQTTGNTSLANIDASTGTIANYYAGGLQAIPRASAAQGAQYVHISTNTTTSVNSGGTLYLININTGGSNAVATLKSGATTVAVIDATFPHTVDMTIYGIPLGATSIVTTGTTAADLTAIYCSNC